MPIEIITEEGKKEEEVKELYTEEIPVQSFGDIIKQENPVMLSQISHNLGSMTAGSLKISNAWHIDKNGNMWWGDYATYADATIKISATGSVNLTTGAFSGTFTAGTVRTAASGARVEMTAANNRLDIYNATPTNIGWFGGAGANGNFIYVNQPDTNQDYPPVYVTSAQDSNVINVYNTNASLANRPAFRIESNNALSETMYIKQTANYQALNVETNSADQPTLYLTQSGTAKIIDTNVAGCYLTKAGVWTDASSKKIKENFENITVLDKLNNLNIKKYNYISEQKKNKEQIKEQLIDKRKREKYSQTDEGKKGGYNDTGYLKEKITTKELKEIDSETNKEYIKDQKRETPKHISPMAEDLYEMFGVGDDKSISPKDLAGIALQAIKELSEKVKKLENAK